MVVNVPPDNQIRQIGRVNGQLHVYNTNNPPAATTTYNITIINVGNQNGVAIAAGHTDSYNPAGNAVYIQNSGPSRLQVLYQGADLAPHEAGWSVVKSVPSA